MDELDVGLDTLEDEGLGSSERVNFRVAECRIGDAVSGVNDVLGDAEGEHKESKVLHRAIGGLRLRY